METNKIMVAVLVGLTWGASARELSTGSKDAAFVGQLDVLSSVKAVNASGPNKLALARVSETLSSQLVSALSATRQFQMVDRSRLGEIMEEQKLGTLGVVDPNDPNVAKALSLAGAKYILQPKLDAFEVKNEVAQFSQIGRSTATRTVYASAVVQMVDTTTGELLPEVPSVQLSLSETVQMAQDYQSLTSDKLLVDLAKALANKLSQRVIGVLRPAKVLSVRGSQVMINRGAEAGFAKGGMVELFAVEKIVDEDTGEVFLDEMMVAQAVIVRGDTKKCFAQIQGNNMGVQKGAVARLFEPIVLAPSVAPAMNQGINNTPGSSEQPLRF